MKDNLQKNWPIALALIVLLLAVIKFANDRGYFQHVKTGAQTETAQTIEDYCNNPTNAAKDLGKESCFSKQFRQLAKDQGPKNAFSVLHELQSIDPSTRGCHLIAHGIGWGTFEHDPKAWQNDIQTIEPSCNYGAPHGIIEAYLETQPDHTLTKTVIPTLCGPTPRADCNHIIGHLILVETRADVPKALDLCDVFDQNPTQLDHCYTGVFMEYQTALNLIEHGFAPQSWLNWPARVPELEKMCRSYTDRKAKDCWKEIVHAALVKFNNDPKTIFDFCSTAQVSDGAKECRRHAIGIMAAGKQFDLPNLKSMCDLAQPDDSGFKSDCYVQLAASTLSTVPDEQDRVKQFCESLDSSYQSICLSQITSYNNYSRSSGND